jgi:hypothetical protein
VLGLTEIESVSGALRSRYGKKYNDVQSSGPEPHLHGFMSQFRDNHCQFSHAHLSASVSCLNISDLVSSGSDVDLSVRHHWKVTRILISAQDETVASTPAQNTGIVGSNPTRCVDSPVFVLPCVGSSIATRCLCIEINSATQMGTVA